MNTYKGLDLAISELNPNIIAVEETQYHMDMLMKNIDKYRYSKKYYNTKMKMLADKYPDSNIYKLKGFIQDET
ncbi:MAG: hypothetical protein K0B07_02275 [DPANN group archaeon]|nr:hypothetical protein [DPANN group archaeon]